MALIGTGRGRHADRDADPSPEGGRLSLSAFLAFWDPRGWRTRFPNAQDTGFPSWPVPSRLCDLPHHSVLWAPRLRDKREGADDLPSSLQLQRPLSRPLYRRGQGQAVPGRCGPKGRLGWGAQEPRRLFLPGAEPPSETSQETTSVSSLS